MHSWWQQRSWALGLHWMVENYCTNIAGSAVINFKNPCWNNLEIIYLNN
jgi:hypothetical protein